ncbi:MAG: metallopeptidase family protein [Marinibacterium sp.]|nr:metallopeptidase family protein [Marinibacterium sp.]
MDRIEPLVTAALERLPEQYRNLACAVAINVADWPDPAMLEDLGMTEPLELTGLYEGVPLTEKSTMDQPVAPDVIWLFQEPILAEWRTRGDVELADLVSHVLVHELAHHFGWTDAQIAEIDQWWE